MTLNVFGDGGALQPFEPSEAAPEGDRFRQADYVGRPAAVTVHGSQEVTGGAYGPSTVIIADVKVLAADGTVKVFEKAWLRGGAVHDALLPLTGQTKAVKFVMTPTKDGKRTYHDVAAPDAKEFAALSAALGA